MSSNFTENPFAALFPSVGDAHEFAVKNQKNEDQINAESVREKLGINNLIEKIFLITFDKEEYGDSERPAFLVYLEDLAQMLDNQTWLDMECLEQAVFERLMLPDPSECMISTKDTANGENPQHSASAAQSVERQVVNYLYGCFCRLHHACTQPQNDRYSMELTKLRTIIISNTRVSLQQSELFPDQRSVDQLVAIYMEEQGLGDEGLNKTFFDSVIQDLLEHEEDGSLKKVFEPILKTYHKRFEKEMTLMTPGLVREMEILYIFCRHESLAKLFMQYSAPSDWSKGKGYERTLLGSLFSYSCLTDPLQPQSEMYFENPSNKTKQEIDIEENNIQQPIGAIYSRVFQFLYSLIKVSADVKQLVLAWIGKCLQANAGRCQIWASQMPQVYSKMYASDGFCLNLSYVLLSFCQPFVMEQNSEKVHKIQPSYSSYAAEKYSSNQQSGSVSKETCLVPREENESTPVEDNYNFITECFFLTHHSFYIGFHQIHDKFIKLNQELHRIQNLYQEMRAQGGTNEAGPVRTVKAQMDKGMMMYLSMKAALSQPQLLDMSLNFHIATAIWLSKVAISDNLEVDSDIKFPLPEAVPQALKSIPEFIMGNVTDFVMFLHRFKTELNMTAGERLSHLMTLILVYMGSPERLKNPHLRAELAEVMATLLPVDPDQPATSSFMGSSHKEFLFTSHPFAKHIAEKLLHVFVSIEMTGQSVQFEQKFQYRRPMYRVLEYIWGMEVHNQAVKELAAEAERNIEATDPPLFLRFINLLINDAIFLLDEALTYMSQIKEKQAAKESGAWQELPQQQRQEEEGNLRQVSMLARYHNIMSNLTIHALEIITQQIKSIFCHPTMVDRIAAMLNYFLLNLVGPRQRNYKVKDKNEYEFKPHQIVSDICQIYLNLGDSETFCKAVAGDGRSFSPELFPKAISILERIGQSPTVISSFAELSGKIEKIYEQQKEDDLMLDDAPEEFLDPIMGTLMREPVILPSSRNIVDKSVIARHILSDQNDPFNRSPLSLDMVIPNNELKAKIDAWISEKRAAKSKS